MDPFINNMPKVELHVHLEGTLEPELVFLLAKRNGVELNFENPAALKETYKFTDLPSFLAVYYRAVEVLQTERDFHDMTLAYLDKAAKNNIRYVEAFFDPQAHTRRGIPLEVVLTGIKEGQETALERTGIRSELIMCFLRDLSADSAFEHLCAAIPFQDYFIGVGLDSDEKGNPPIKFLDVFSRAKSEGLKLTMHCDVNQENSLDHIWQCVDDIGADRIDHGVNAIEDEALMSTLAEKNLGLTICPLSNSFVVQTLTTGAIDLLMRREVPVTINSDDPAYFGGYLSDNIHAISQAGFDNRKLVRLAQNAIDVSWAPESLKASLTKELREFCETASC